MKLESGIDILINPLQKQVIKSAYIMKVSFKSFLDNSKCAKTTCNHFLQGWHRIFPSFVSQLKIRQLLDDIYSNLINQLLRKITQNVF